MLKTPKRDQGRARSRLCRVALASALALPLLLLVAAPAAAQVSYFVFGRATSVHTPVAQVESTTTSALPGVTAGDPEPEGTVSSPVPLPGVTIEAYDAGTEAFLGKGRANREGYYNLGYDRPAEANHEVYFLLFYDFADGGREFLGQVDRTPAGDPIVVNSRLFSFDLELENDEAVRAGTASFSSVGEFVFLEVGDVDMDDIYDQQADPGDASRWGLTKPPSPGHTLGPDLAFGGTLDLYGLFGEGTGPADEAHYYRINYSGAESGSICDPLYKKNYVIVGSSVEVYRVKLGPLAPADLPAPLGSCVYRLDERLVGQPIPGTGHFYSAFWTELGRRALWSSRTVADGGYVLEVEAWNAVGTALPAATNDFATLNLKIDNRAPQSKIHNIQYLDGSVVLSDAAPCQTVVLNEVTSSTDDDSLQFLITASHPGNLVRSWSLRAWHGHDTFDGTVAEASYIPMGPDPAVVNQVFQTPGSIGYQTCAYRFRLRVVPRITDGYDLIYVRDDNWYAAISVLTP